MFFKVPSLVIALAVTLPGLVFVEYVANQCGYTYNLFSATKESAK